MRAACLLPVALSGLALLACGGDDGGVREAFHDLRRDWLAEDYSGVCSRLSEAAKREVGSIGHGDPGRCRDDMATRMSAAIVTRRDLAGPTIERIEIDGDRATVMARLGGTTLGDVRFVREDGTWKLDRVFGKTAPAARTMR